MTTRAQNERKFLHWKETSNGGRIYWLDVDGRSGWSARYLKEVDGNEITRRFRQEVYDDEGRLGLADVREFGLAWEDYEELLESLGYTARVEIKAS